MGNTYTNYEIQNVSTPQQLLDESKRAIRQLGDTSDSIDGTYKSESESLIEYNRANKIALDNCNQVPNFATSQTLLSKDQLEKYIVSQSNVPNSVDIREWGLINSIQNQGSCGSCWAFTTRNVVDSLILHDMKYWREIYNESELVQKWTTKTFRSSVQFVLNNSYGNNYMCGGGNFINAAVDVAYGYVPGIELNSVVGYTSFSSVDEKPEKDPQRIPLQTQEFINYQLIPVHYYNSQSDCPAVLFSVAASSKSQGFGVESDKVTLIKRLLATGMALSGRMHTEGSNNEEDTQAFQMYSKGVLRDAKCETQTSNHQITLIGYGHYQGEAVWVFANSWGTSWGQQGSNYLCTELDVYGMIPRFRGYNQTLENTQIPFNETEQYKEMKENSILTNLNENQIVRGINGLDDYDEENNPIHYQKKLTIGFYIICLLLLIFLGIWISFALRCMCCPLKKTIKEPQYLQTSKADLNNADFGSQFNLTVTL